MTAPAVRGGSAVSGGARSERVRAGALEVDRHPVTNGRYAAFVEETGHRPPCYWPGGRLPASLVNHPVVGVDLFDALAFARWAGGAIPTEEEWRLAAGPVAPGAYAWGDRFEGGRCNTVRSGHKGTTPVDAFPGGAAPSGCLDLCGNVWELTVTPYPGDAEAIVVKGGSWYDYPVHARLDSRFRAPIARGGPTTGLRLVYGRPWAAPACIPAELVEECMRFRKRKEGEREGEEAGAQEFAATLQALQREVEARIVDLDEAAADAGLDVVAALDRLEEVLEAAPPEEPGAPALPVPAPPSPPPRNSTLLQASPSRFRAHPLAVAGILASALLLVGWLVVSVSATRGAGRVPSRERATEEARTPTPEVSRSAAPPDRAAVREALRALAEGSDRKWAEAETRLLALGASVRPDLEEALAKGPNPKTESSLRYLIALIEEAAEPSGKPPRAAEGRLRPGLLFCFAFLDQGTMAEARKVRLTAAAEGVPFLALYNGPAPASEVLQSTAAALRGSEVAFDADGSLSALLRAQRSPHIAALGQDLQPYATHTGPIGRAAIAEMARTLRTILRGW
ncbi:MAG: formylglycine-generating enzyme family protein [Planctomycetaceae bacterium]